MATKKRKASASPKFSIENKIITGGAAIVAVVALGFFGSGGSVEELWGKTPQPVIPVDLNFPTYIEPTYIEATYVEEVVEEVVAAEEVVVEDVVVEPEEVTAPEVETELN